MPRFLITVAMTALLLLAAGPVAAQTPAQPGSPTPAPAAAPEAAPDPAAQLELTRSVIQVQRQAIVTQAMDLEPKESEVFWPLYRAYRMDMAKVNDRFVKLLGTYMEHYETLSDQMARRLLDEYLGIEGARHQVKVKHVARFRKALPSRKVARFFQVENKLDAVINAELAEQIPYAR